MQQFETLSEAPEEPEMVTWSPLQYSTEFLNIAILQLVVFPLKQVPLQL